MEVRDESGRLIATIHDPKAFCDLLDSFEKHLEKYSYMRFPLNKMNILIDQNTLDKIKHSAQELQKLREQFGDDRINLYPVDLPNQS